MRGWNQGGVGGETIIEQIGRSYTNDSNDFCGKDTITFTVSLSVAKCLSSVSLASSRLGKGQKIRYKSS